MISIIWMFEGCSNLTEITIPQGVTLIESWAFERCTSLTSIIIPDTVVVIEDYAFDDASNLQSVYYIGSADQWENIEIGNRYNGYLTDCIRYYYSESEPLLEGNYWHYINGIPTVW